MQGTLSQTQTFENPPVKKTLPTLPIAPKEPQILLPKTTLTTKTTMTQTKESSNTTAPDIVSAGRAMPSNEPAAVWYLGGNHIVKLLTSVSGDFDPDVLAKLAGVPSVVGELALSVESLVSDDLTVGGFESDLLARIASNTLSGKRENMNSATAAVSNSTPQPQPQPHQESTDSSTLSSSATPVATSTTVTTQETEEQTPFVPTGSVPNPLLLESYEPVPNPLARITPPASPSPSVSGKRKEDALSSDEEEDVHEDYRKSKVIRRNEMTMIQAR
jgi:hypothetical protein